MQLFSFLKIFFQFDAKEEPEWLVEIKQQRKEALDRWDQKIDQLVKRLHREINANRKKREEVERMFAEEINERWRQWLADVKYETFVCFASMRLTS